MMQIYRIAAAMAFSVMPVVLGGVAATVVTGSNETTMWVPFLTVLLLAVQR